MNYIIEKIHRLWSAGIQDDVAIIAAVPQKMCPDHEEEIYGGPEITSLSQLITNAGPIAMDWKEEHDPREG